MATVVRSGEWVLTIGVTRSCAACGFLCGARKKPHGKDRAATVAPQIFVKLYNFPFCPGGGGLEFMRVYVETHAILFIPAPQSII